VPDRDVETIRDLIYYQYAKIIARSAFKMSNKKGGKRRTMAEKSRSGIWCIYLMQEAR
jgi:hypothetical protein